METGKSAGPFSLLSYLSIVVMEQDRIVIWMNWLCSLILSTINAVGLNKYWAGHWAGNEASSWQNSEGGAHQSQEKRDWHLCWWVARVLGPNSWLLCFHSLYRRDSNIFYLRTFNLSLLVFTAGLVDIFPFRRLHSPCLLLPSRCIIDSVVDWATCNIVGPRCHPHDGICRTLIFSSVRSWGLCRFCLPFSHSLCPPAENKETGQDVQTAVSIYYIGVAVGIRLLSSFASATRFRTISLISQKE